MQIHPTQAGMSKHNITTASSTTTTIIAGKLFDPYTLELLLNQKITTCEATGLILDVQKYTESSLRDIDWTSPKVVDLRNQTVLPGFVDTHVHFFLHPYSETSWDDQLTKESLAERTIRATNHARATLLAGFTTVRDLGTEGALDADIALRKCISGPNAIIPGPRYFTANRAIVPTGSYGPKGVHHVNEEGIEGITGAEVADGVEGCRKAVRRQVGSGADWIKVNLSETVLCLSWVYADADRRAGKIYADYRFRSRMDDVSPQHARASIATFHTDELKALISTAHQLGAKVAAHASTAAAAFPLIDLGVDSIEHGHLFADDAAPAGGEAFFKKMADKGTMWVPTLSVYYTFRASGDDDEDSRPNRPDPRGGAWDGARTAFAQGRAVGVNMACGGDTGTFPHGENALEMQLMVRLGADWRHVLRWATLGGWECVRSMAWEGSGAGLERENEIHECKEAREVVGDNEMPFGAVRKGFSADLVATSGDLEQEFERAVSAECISFVMKIGKIYKRNGRPLV